MAPCAEVSFGRTRTKLSCPVETDKSLFARRRMRFRRKARKRRELARGGAAGLGAGSGGNLSSAGSALGVARGLAPMAARGNSCAAGGLVLRARAARRFRPSRGTRRQWNQDQIAHARMIEPCLAQ